MSASIEPIVGTDNIIPPYKYFRSAGDALNDMKYKQVTIAEYFTDPLITYGMLWGCFGITYNLWERIGDDADYINFVGNSSDNYLFADRLKMEPFTPAKNQNLTKYLTDLNGNLILDSYGNPITVLNNDFYIKNIIEPVCFIEIALYLRSKGYHPILIIGELFTLSILYEFTVRALFMDTSFEQLIKNPAVGALFGLLIDEFSNYLLSTPYMGFHVLGYILNPFKLLPVKRIYPMLFLSPHKPAVTLEVIASF